MFLTRHVRINPDKSDIKRFFKKETIPILKANVSQLLYNQDRGSFPDSKLKTTKLMSKIPRSQLEEAPTGQSRTAGTLTILTFKTMYQLQCVK